MLHAMSKNQKYSSNEAIVEVLRMLEESDANNKDAIDEKLDYLDGNDLGNDGKFSFFLNWITQITLSYFNVMKMFMGDKFFMLLFC